MSFLNSVLVRDCYEGWLININIKAYLRFYNILFTSIVEYTSAFSGQYVAVHTIL